MPVGHGDHFQRLTAQPENDQVRERPQRGLPDARPTLRQSEWVGRASIASESATKASPSSIRSAAYQASSSSTSASAARWNQIVKVTATRDARRVGP